MTTVQVDVLMTVAGASLAISAGVFALAIVKLIRSYIA